MHNNYSEVLYAQLFDSSPRSFPVIYHPLNITYLLKAGSDF